MNRLLLTMAVLFLGCSARAQVEADSANSAEPAPLLREVVTFNDDRENGCEQGDTVHFEAFVEREGLTGATDYSGVLYVELLNPAGEVVVRKKLPLVDGWAKGEVAVDTLYGSGFYELRAYTRYMSNWADEQYFTRVLPVFVPQSKLTEDEENGVRYINLSTRAVDLDERMEAYHDRRSTVFELKQPMEKGLMVFGHITPKYKEPTRDDLQLADRHLKVVASRDKEVLVGDATTDVNGMFGLYLPDVQGEWSLRIISSKRGSDAANGMTRHRVEVDGLFAPRYRNYRKEELKPQRYGLKKWKNDPSAKYPTLFINCEESSLWQKNQGGIPLGFYHFLGMVNRQFARTMGVASPTMANVARDSAFHKYIDIDLIGRDSNDPRTVCVDGPSYNNRPIVWIVDGAYRLVTGLNKEITDFRVFRPTSRPLPLYMDEVKSVFVSEHPEAFYSYMRCSVLEKKKPVTVFITTHSHYIWDDSVLFNTSFEGFSR